MKALRHASVVAFTIITAGCGIFDTLTEPSRAEALEVTDLVVGTGDEAAIGTVVSVYYKGWLWDDGKKGDLVDSRTTGQTPFTFTLGAGEVIQAWDEGLVGMKVGGLRQLVVPPELGYGYYGAGMIPSDASLIFEVQLLSVTPIPRVESLAIVDLVVGTGAEAVNGKRLGIYYTGWIWDVDAPDNKGEIFATSTTEVVTFRLGVGEVLMGLDQGLPGMKVGGVRRVLIPPDLAYGASGSGDIPPFASLVVEVELLSVAD